MSPAIWHTLLPLQLGTFHCAASSHTHTATQITGFTAGRALISDSAGRPTVSAVTTTELGYLDGVTSSIQTQLNSKAGKSVATTSANGLMSSTDKTNLNNLLTRVSDLETQYNTMLAKLKTAVFIKQ